MASLAEARRARQRVETRETLLAAAIELFTEKGFAATSVDAIATRAGYTSGAVYDHFGSKEGVLVAVVEQFLDDPLPLWRDTMSASSSLVDKLTSYGAAMASTPVSPDVQALVHEVYACVLRRPALRDRVGALIEGQLRKAGERIKLEGPLSGTDVVVIGEALLDGLRLRSLLNPSLVRPELYEVGMALMAGIDGMEDLAAADNEDG